MTQRDLWFAREVSCIIVPELLIAALGEGYNRRNATVSAVCGKSARTVGKKHYNEDGRKKGEICQNRRSERRNRNSRHTTTRVASTSDFSNPSQKMSFGASGKMTMAKDLNHSSPCMYLSTSGESFNFPVIRALAPALLLPILNIVMILFARHVKEASSTRSTTFVVPRSDW